MTMQNFNNTPQELDWDGTIQSDSSFITLPEGLYKFTVTQIERARHTPNPQNPGKLPACNKAIVHLKIETNEGEANLKHNLFLHTSTESMLSAFFGALGLKKKGQQLQMNWNHTVGKTGVCKVGIRKHNGNDYNEVKNMIYEEDVDLSKVLNLSLGHPQYAPQQPVQQAPQQTWSGGAF